VNKITGDQQSIEMMILKKNHL